MSVKDKDLEDFKSKVEAFGERDDIHNPDDTGVLSDESFLRTTDEQTQEDLGEIEDFVNEHLVDVAGFADKQALGRARSKGIDVELVPAQYPEDDQPTVIRVGLGDAGQFYVEVQHEEYRN